MPFSRELLGGAIFAAAYSLINLVAVEINNTNDYSYANYLTTFFVWVFSAYPALALMRRVYGSVTFTRVAYYLAAVSVFQVISALLIDNFPVVDDFCTSIVYWDIDFFEGIDRMRCFSVALDPAGVRFALVLVLIATTICVDKEVQLNSRQIYYLFFSFFTIAGIGNMVARTTTTGMGIGLALLLVYSNVVSLKVRSSMVRTMSIFALLLLGAFVLGTYLYNTSSYYREQLEFGFEGFFNLVNNGTFETSSTNILKETIIWPTDDFTWIIGTGDYSGAAGNSDSGYSRLIFYSGLIGFSTFAMSFLFLAQAFARKFPAYVWMFLAYAAMAFIVWVKVSTDTLMIYAFFFWFTQQEQEEIRKITG